MLSIFSCASWPPVCPPLKKHLFQNLFAGQELEMQTERTDTDVWTWRGERRGIGMNWEIRIDMYTLPCVKYTVNGNLLYRIGRSALFSVVT